MGNTLFLRFRFLTIVIKLGPNKQQFTKYENQEVKRICSKHGSISYHHCVKNIFYVYCDGSNTLEEVLGISVSFSQVWSTTVVFNHPNVATL